MKYPQSASLCAHILAYAAAATTTGLALMSSATLWAEGFGQWENSFPADPAFVPIGVWLQSSGQARQYRDIGVNVYVGLHKGPTEEQLTQLREAGLFAIADQNAFTRKLQQENSELLKTIVGWKLEDEPDNAQLIRDEKSATGGKKYGPPVPPEELERQYKALKKSDPTRPVYLNLGQGVAWDHWVGRGVRTNHPEEYVHYTKAGDILSFDVYPVAAGGSSAPIQGEIWRVGYGTRRLREWTAPGKPVWSFIECTRIAGEGKATVDEVRAMVWMAFINGATGIQYFLHEFEVGGKFKSSSALLSDKEMSQGVARINAQIKELAPIINSPNVEKRHTVEPAQGPAGDKVWEDFQFPPFSTMLKEHEGDLYLFAVRMRDSEEKAQFTIQGAGEGWEAEVLGGDRRIALQKGGVLVDNFAPWGTAIYRIRQGKSASTGFDQVKARTLALLQGEAGAKGPPGERAKAALAELDQWTSAHLAKAPVPLNLDAVPPDKVGEAMKDPLADVRRLSQAYRARGGALQDSDQVRDRIIADLEPLLAYYETHPERPRPGNWFFWTITNPDSLGVIGLLMEDALPAPLLERVKAVIADGTGDKMLLSGANAAWEARNHIYRALLTRDEPRLEAAARHAFADLRFTTDSGIREDFGYLFHGRIPYTGGYGAGYVQSLSQTLYILDGTPWTAPPAKRELLANLLLEHMRWFIEGGRLDFLVSGRGYAGGEAAGRIGETMLLLTRIESSRQAELKAGAAAILESGMAVKFELAAMADEAVATPSARLQGFRYWPSCETGAYKGERFHAGFRQFSTRIQDYEFLTQQGGDGWNLAMGFVNLLRADGKGDWINGDAKLKDIDMDHLPGSTSRIGAHPKNPMGNFAETGFSLNYGIETFCGGAGSGSGGVAGFILRPVHGDFVARKSLHFFPRGYWALGSGITAGPRAEGAPAQPVHTTLLQFPTESTPLTITIPDIARISVEETPQRLEARWLWVEGMGVVFREPTPFWVRKRGNVITAWLDHGDHPNNDFYAYAVLPQSSQAEVEAFARELTVAPLQLDDRLHAVQNKATGSTGWVFFAPGASEGLTVNAPAIAYRERASDGAIYTIQNPLHTSAPLEISVEEPAALTYRDPEVTPLEETSAPPAKLSIATRLGRIYRLGFGDAGRQAQPIPRVDLSDFHQFQVRAETSPNAAVFTVTLPESLADQPYRLSLEGVQGHPLTTLKAGEAVAPHVRRYTWNRTPLAGAPANSRLTQTHGDFRLSLQTELKTATVYLHLPAYKENGQVDLEVPFQRDKNSPMRN